MAENGIEGKVIGLALDGTGYGSDGNIWGGEALVADDVGFERAGHFGYVPLPGGAAAIREPWRMGVSYLAQTFGADFLGLDIPFVERLERGKTELILRMMDQRVNSPLTSSCGRLFDAVAAVIGIRQEASYEAQAAMELEMSGRSSRETAAIPSPFAARTGTGRSSPQHCSAPSSKISAGKCARKQSDGDFTTGWSRLSRGSPACFEKNLRSIRSA